MFAHALSVTTVFGGHVPSDSTLLATFEVHGIGVGSREVFESRWPALGILDDISLEFVAPLFEDVTTPRPYPAMQVAEIMFNDDPEFGVFTAYLTDGVSQGLVLVQWSESGIGSGGGGRSEQDIIFHVPRIGPDLIGYSIDRITANLIINIQTPGSDPFGDGRWTDWSVVGAYNFYGAPIPEPTSLALILPGTCLAWSNYRSRKSNVKLQVQSAEPNHKISKSHTITNYYASILLVISFCVCTGSATAQCVVGGGVAWPSAA